MQHKVVILTFSNLIEANEMLSELLTFNPTIRLRRPIDIDSATMVRFSDASHGGKSRDYGQTGGIIGLRIRDNSGGRYLNHILNWTSYKQKRISHSSFGAELIAAVIIKYSFDAPRSARVQPKQDDDHAPRSFSVCSADILRWLKCNH